MLPSSSPQYIIFKGSVSLLKLIKLNKTPLTKK